MNKISLPIHRRYLLEFWWPKSASRLHKANSLIAEVIQPKLWKERIEPGKEVPSFIEDKANDAMNQIREAIEECNDPLLGDIFEAVREIRELREHGLRQDYTRKIILAYSQFYYENKSTPQPLVWVEAIDPPRGITLAPRGYWTRVVEPTKKQLWLRICANGERIPKSTYTHYLKKIGLNDLKEDPAGRRSRKPKLVSKRFL